MGFRDLDFAISDSSRLVKYAGIVLCGGRSRRMGVPKWALPFGPEPMLRRVARLLAQAADEVIVVAAPNQTLPDLAAPVRLVHDRWEGRGPLEGLRAGLAALSPGCQAAYATGCDAPLLAPAFVRRMFELLGDDEIAVPDSGGHAHPLSAAYRCSVLPAIDRLLAADRLRMTDLFESVPTRKVLPRELLDIDPELATLRNFNSPAEYREAVTQAGFEVPANVLAELASQQQ